MKEVRREVVVALLSLYGEEGIDDSNLFENVRKVVPDVSHDDLGLALHQKLKDLFPHKDFPSGVSMALLNKVTKEGGRLDPIDCTME